MIHQRCLMFAVCLGVALAASNAAHAQFPAVGALAKPTPPDVMTQIPADSSLFLVIPSLKNLETNLTRFAPAVGADPDNPATKAPVTFMLQQLGAGKGVNMDGSAAAVMPMLMMGARPRFYIALPITDQATFLQNFGDVAAAPNVEGVQQAGLPNGQQVYFKFSGKYVIASDIEMTVANQKPAQDLTKLYRAAGKLGRANLHSGDAFAYINLSKVGPMLSGMAAMGLSGMQMQIMQQPDMVEQMGGKDAVTALFRGYGTLLSNILLKTDALVIGARADDKGAKLTYSLQFKPDSPPAQVFAKTSKMDLTMNRLPEMPYFMAMSLDTTAMDYKPLLRAIDEIHDAIDAQSAIAKVLKAYRANIDLMKHYDLAEFAWYAPTPGKTTPFINFAYVYGSKDPGAAMKDMRAGTKLMVEAYNALAAANEDESMQMKYEQAKSRVADHEVDHFTMKMNMNQMFPMGLPDDMPRFIKDMLDTWTFQMTQGRGAILAATGDDGALLQKVLGVQDGSGKLGRGELIAEARKHLPGDRFMEMYFDPSAIMRFAMDVAKAEGEDVPDVKVPLMTPMAASGSSAEGGFAVTAFAPISSIESITKFIMEAEEAERKRWQNEGHGDAAADEAVGVEAAPIRVRDKQAH